MRQHFHRCAHLRVIALDASDLSRVRRGGGPVLEELCDAKGLAPCLGLAECDVLSPEEKRALLAVRVTRLRAEEGGRATLGDSDDARAPELQALREELLEEREEIAVEYRRLAAEMAAVLDREDERPVQDPAELQAAAASPRFDEVLRALRSARLDAIDRALEALERGGYGACVRCGKAIGIGRLRAAPDTRVCEACARDALPSE